MKIPLRIIQQKTLSSDTKFSLLGGIKTLFWNLKILCTQRILGSGYGWYKTSSKVEIITDYSFQEIDGELKFIKTPSSADGYQTALEITQEINKEY